MKSWMMLALGMVVLTAGMPALADGPEVTALKETLTTAINGSTTASDEMKTFACEKLAPLCTNPVFVAEVAAQNAKGLTLERIKQTDEAWIAAEDELAIHGELLGNACAAEIKKVCKQVPALTEVFVMDNQGANVGQNALTSDYWQGDEPKWRNSFNGGEGGVDISKPKLDKSSGSVDQKVSLPIIDASGNVIGAVCFGVNPDAV